MRIKKSKHEQTVDMLVERLVSSGKFDKVERNIKYCFPEANGQVDVMAFIGNKIYGK